MLGLKWNQGGDSLVAGGGVNGKLETSVMQGSVLTSMPSTLLVWSLPTR